MWPISHGSLYRLRWGLPSTFQQLSEGPPVRIRSFFAATTILVVVTAPVFTAAPASAKDKWCDSLKKVATKIKAMDQPPADPKATVKVLKDVADSMKSIQGKAPSAIKSDWSKMSKGIGDIADLSNKMLNIKAADMAKKLPALQKDMDKITNDKSFSVSGDKVTAWAKKNCGIDLDA